MKIGFIGLGMMGSGMAANLQKAGHDLVVHDLRRAAAEPYLAKGAAWADSPRAVAEAAEVVFTSLPGPPEVEAVALGESGLLSGMSRGKAYFDLSTNSPTMVRKINAAFAERDVYMLDAPVSGGPRGARTGKLALWVGGDEQIFNRHKSVLDAMGDKARYVGPIGAGSVAKLVHNGAGYCIQTALAEMFTVGVKAGVEPLALCRLRATAGAQGCDARHPARPRFQRADADRQPGAGRIVGGAEPRLGRSRLARADGAAAGARGGRYPRRRGADQGGSRPRPAVMAASAQSD
jgi:3-hydroxyisobutyrate dehydrogenase-like beta-hydroxyacid dehydrogenase